MADMTEPAAGNPVDDNLFEMIDSVYRRATVGDILAAHSNPQHPLRVLAPQCFTTAHRQVTVLLTRFATTMGRFRLQDQGPVYLPSWQGSETAGTLVLGLIDLLRLDIRNLRMSNDRSEMSWLLSQHSATIDLLARTIRVNNADHMRALSESETRGSRAQWREQAARRTARYYAIASLILGVVVIIMWLG